jgi:hypothetical protein
MVGIKAWNPRNDITKPYEKHKVAYNSLNFWDLEVSNSLKEAACQCASTDTLLAKNEQKMSSKSSKIACSGKNSVLKGGIPAIASYALIFRS